MISLYSGTPGSGKSLHAAQVILNRCRAEKLTLGNFEINRNIKGQEWYEYYNNYEITPQFLVDRSRRYFDEEGHKFKEGAIVLILDECQLLFNVREWNMKGRSDWITFFTQHRKLGYDIVLIAQFDRMIDKQLRSLLEYEFIHRKMSNFGWKGKMISVWTGHRLFVCVQRWYPLKERIGAERFLYTKELGSLYDTNLIFDKPEIKGDDYENGKKKKDRQKQIEYQDSEDIEFIEL